MNGQRPGGGKVPPGHQVPALPERSTTARNTLSGYVNRQGNPSEPMTVTVSDLELIIRLAWECGRDHQPEGQAEFLDDAAHVRPDPPRLTHEQRVQQRIAEMETIASRSESTWRGRYPGGPAVDWDTGRVIA